MTQHQAMERASRAMVAMAESPGAEGEALAIQFLHFEDEIVARFEKRLNCGRRAVNILGAGC